MTRGGCRQYPHADDRQAARNRRQAAPAWVNGDAAHLERALRNLTENAIVRNVVTEHGSVAASSELDRGSTFTLVLPAVTPGLEPAGR